MTTLGDQELVRARWRRARAAAHLQDVEDAAFAAGGLGQRLDEVAMRCLVLPRDPESGDVSVDEETVERLVQAVQDWGKEHNVSHLWGHGKATAVDGAVVFDYRDSPRAE